MKTTRHNGERPIMEWIYAGPYERDVSDLYESNYSVPIEPYLPLVEEAKLALRSCRPVEGQPMNVFGRLERWAYKRTEPSETKLTWARYGAYARFLATYAYNRIVTDRGGIGRFRLWVAGGAVVLINGKEVFGRERAGRVEGEYRFEAELERGTNHCAVLLFNVHLHCTNSFALTLERDEFHVELPLLLDAADRDRLEDDFAKFYLAQHILQDRDRVTVNLDEPLECKGSWVFSIYAGYRGEKLGDDPEWEQIRSIPGHVGEIPLCACEQLRGVRRIRESALWKGDYFLSIDYIAEDGSRVEGVRLAFRHVKWIDRLEEENYEQRKRSLIRQYAESDRIIPSTRQAAFEQLARLSAGREDLFDIAAVEQVIQYIDRRYDCADFALHGLLRMYYRYRDSDALPDELKQSMKRCILGFKYWEDEPGHSMMFTRSENHEILFFSAEYLAGLLFPAEPFPNSGQNGLFHIQKGKAMAERWIKEKGTYGFMEWHSNVYYEEDLLALLNLYDFAEANSYIRMMARNLIDLICLLIATHSYRGVMGTTHGRCYEDDVIHPELEPMSHINWLLFGVPKRFREDRLSIGAVALADSGYTPHAAFERIANSEEELYTLTRMGLFPHDGLGGVNCATYRTSDYMVSGLVESMKGRFGHQLHAGQALLSGNIPIFVTCFDNKSEMTRPSYWGGQYRNPKTITHKNVLAYIYKIDETAGYTHCYFPVELFDETAQAGKWLFGRKYNAYVAVYSLKPYKITTSGAYKNRELLCMDKRNVWIIEAGNKSRFGSFRAFVRDVSEAGLIERGEEVEYDSPSVGQMRLGWDQVCTIDGSPALQDSFPLVRNEYAEGAYGSGLTYLRLYGEQKILNFNL